jgi:starvation-inducible DNA-binding protein
MQIQTGITEKNRQIISEQLMKYLADNYALFLKTQLFHWNLTGAEFFSLHLLFEKQYEGLFESLDVIAERIRALGFFVEGSFSSFKNLTSIPEANKTMNSREMIEQLLEGREIIIRQGRSLSSLAENDNDFATVDMMGKELHAHEKAAWMLRSHL